MAGLADQISNEQMVVPLVNKWWSLTGAIWDRNQVSDMG
jgi:hypothetical protein